ncbi:MAG: ATP-binding protein [Thermoplasmataceae archaeon]
MTEAGIQKVKLYLMQGLQSEVAGKLEDARESYLNAKVALENSGAKDTVEEKRKKQIGTLASAIERIDKRLAEQSSNEGSTEGQRILKEIGIDPVRNSGVKLSDVIGLEDVKREIFLRVIYPMKFRELSEEYNVAAGGGILLYGPPGNGKTFIAKAVASEMDAYFIYVNPSTVYSQWFGNFEKNITAIFRAAALLEPSIIFFDEIDAMVPSRERADSDVVRRGVSQFLNELGGFSSKPSRNVFIMGATNIPWNIDSALTRPGRFDRLIYVPPPDRSQRAELFRSRIASIRNTERIETLTLAERTDGYSAADIDYICRRAAEEVFLKAVSGKEKRPVSMEDFESAISSVKPSVGRSVIERYEQFSRQR